MKTAAIIPARFASTRMPGKVLMDLCGHPMIWWVWKHTIQVREFDEVYIAADDERVQRVCEKFGAKVIMPGMDCGCLMDRLFQVSKIMEADYYISINGDGSLLESEVMKAVLPDYVELDLQENLPIQRRSSIRAYENGNRKGRLLSLPFQKPNSIALHNNPVFLESL